MSKIELDKQASETLARLLVRHLKDELDLEIAPFDALDLVAFLAQTLGPHFYNQGLLDAQVVLKDRMESIQDAVSALEKPVRV